MRKSRRHLGMARLAHDDHTVALSRELLGSAMDLLHKGAGSVDHRRAELARLGLFGWRHAVSAKDKRAAGRLAGVAHDQGAALGKACHHTRVMDERTKGAHARRALRKGVLSHLESALDAIAGTGLAGNLHLYHAYILPGCSSRSSSRRA